MKTMIQTLQRRKKELEIKKKTKQRVTENIKKSTVVSSTASATK